MKQDKERLIVLKNQISIGDIMTELHRNNKKPFVARTSDGDYFFSTKEEAQAFALARNGFFDTLANISRSEKAKNLRWRWNDKKTNINLEK